MKDIINETLYSDDGDSLFESIIKDLDKSSLVESIYKNCNDLKKSIYKKDKFLAEVYQILLEADVQFLNAQIFVLSNLIDHPKVELWGKEKIDNWSDLSNDKKVENIFKYFASKSPDSPLAKARYLMQTSDLVNKSDKAPMLVYDIQDVEEPYTGIKSKHWDQFKKSEIYNQLKEIFLDSF
jgi:hypothetical protein